MKHNLCRLFVFCVVLVASMALAVAALAADTVEIKDLRLKPYGQCKVFSSSKTLWCSPQNGGFFSVETMNVDTSQYEYTLEGATALFQACVDAMQTSYDYCDVTLQDIMIRHGYYILHTHDVSISTGFYVASDGYMIWMPDGVVTLWFASNSENGSMDKRFIKETLSSVKVREERGNPDSEYVKLFNFVLVNKLMSVDQDYLFMWECETYSYKKIARSPIDYNGKRATYSGTVLQVIEDGLQSDFRLQLQDSTDVIYVTYRRSSEHENRILEGDALTIWGTLGDLTTYTSTLGRQVTIPTVNAKYLMLLEE